MRLTAIDSFRGFTIVLMVFYSLAPFLASDLPYLLVHNKNGTLHPGDFVLPMFLFASGMSLVFFKQKYLAHGYRNYARVALQKLLKLTLIWIPLSLFSSNYLLGLDEIMLNVLLMLPTLLLVCYSDRSIAFAFIAILSVHCYAALEGWLPNFSEVYLGGFKGAFFYLPIFLAGVLVARHQDKSLPIGLLLLLFSALLCYLSPPLKMELTFSFIVLSCAISAIIFTGFKNCHTKTLIELGKKPLRFWVLMFLLFVIPLKTLSIMGLQRLPLSFHWSIAIVLLCGCLATLHYCSRAIDWILATLEQLESKKAPVLAMN